MRSFTDLSYGSLDMQKLDIYLPDSEEFAAFVYFHGGGLINGSRKCFPEEVSEYFTKRGVALISVEYRMYPDAEYPDFIEDAAKSVAWVKNNISNYGNCKGIYVGGSSAGGYLSMMLCFDRRYLENEGVDPLEIKGWIHDAGQPTAHFVVLKNSGADSRRIIVDERAPLYYVGLEKEHSPMLVIVSDYDMQNRYEQTMLLMSTLKHFELDGNVELLVMHGTHCAYVQALDEKGDSVLGKAVCDFMAKY